MYSIVFPNADASWFLFHFVVLCTEKLVIILSRSSCAGTKHINMHACTCFLPMKLLDVQGIGRVQNSTKQILTFHREWRFLAKTKEPSGFSAENIHKLGTNETERKMTTFKSRRDGRKRRTFNAFRAVKEMNGTETPVTLKCLLAWPPSQMAWNEGSPVPIVSTNRRGRTSDGCLEHKGDPVKIHKKGTKRRPTLSQENKHQRKIVSVLNK